MYLHKSEITNDDHEDGDDHVVDHDVDNVVDDDDDNAVDDDDDNVVNDDDDNVVDDGCDSRAVNMPFWFCAISGERAGGTVFLWIERPLRPLLGGRKS